MASVKLQSNIQIELRDIIKSVAQLETSELEQFVNQLNNLLAIRKAPNLPVKEAELLLKINQWLPPELKQKYDELTAKRRDFMLSKVEHEQLLELVEIVEMQHVERMKNLIELAKLRQISLDELMETLGIMPTVYV